MIYLHNEKSNVNNVESLFSINTRFLKFLYLNYI